MSYPAALAGEIGRYERWDVDRHTEAFAAMCSDPAVMRYLGGRQRPEAAAEVSHRIADHWETFGFGLWAALDDSDRLAGFVGAARTGPAWEPQFAGSTEVGWRLARWAWGRGFATEGAGFALAAGAAHLGMTEMIAFVDPANARSQAVAHRLSMECRGRALDRRLGVTVDVFGMAAPTTAPTTTRSRPRAAPMS